MQKENLFPLQLLAELQDVIRNEGSLSFHWDSISLDMLSTPLHFWRTYIKARTILNSTNIENSLNDTPMCVESTMINPILKAVKASMVHGNMFLARHFLEAVNLSDMVTSRDLSEYLKLGQLTVLNSVSSCNNRFQNNYVRQIESMLRLVDENRDDERFNNDIVGLYSIPLKAKLATLVSDEFRHTNLMEDITNLIAAVDASKITVWEQLRYFL